MRLLTITDLSDAFQVSPMTIYRWVKRGVLPAPVKVGRTSRWLEDDITAYLDALKEQRSEDGTSTQDS